MTVNKIGRNNPCPCGSSKKYKKCCLNKINPNYIVNNKVSDLIEPHLHLVRSIIHEEYRVRAVFNKLHIQPIKETFHEFLILVVKWTFGEKWWKIQTGMNPDDRHAFVNWNYAFYEFTKKHMTDSHKENDGWTYSIECSGSVWALLTFGYDLLCLQHKNYLPDFFIERLRKKKSFQGARYEIVAAAIMIRSGFQIKYLDKEEKSKNHCEFIALHEKFEIKIGVEAKSRVRSGVLNKKGEFSYSEDRKRIKKLVNEAKKQKPNNLPFLIFIDINLPLTPKVPFNEKPWVKDIQNVLNELHIPSSENPDPYNAIIITNFSYHYEEIKEGSVKSEWGIIISQFPETSLPNTNILNIINDTLNRYDRIPREI